MRIGTYDTGALWGKRIPGLWRRSVIMTERNRAPATDITTANLLGAANRVLGEERGRSTDILFQTLDMPFDRPSEARYFMREAIRRGRIVPEVQRRIEERFEQVARAKLSRLRRYLHLLSEEAGRQEIKNIADQLAEVARFAEQRALPALSSAVTAQLHYLKKIAEGPFGDGETITKIDGVEIPESMYPGCFVCDNNTGPHFIMRTSRTPGKARERILAMFNSGASSQHEAVVIGACSDHRPNLERLNILLLETGIVTPGLIADARKGIKIRRLPPEIIALEVKTRKLPSMPKPRDSQYSTSNLVGVFERFFYDLCQAHIGQVGLKIKRFDLTTAPSGDEVLIEGHGACFRKMFLDTDKSLEDILDQVTWQLNRFGYLAEEIGLSVAIQDHQFAPSDVHIGVLLTRHVFPKHSYTGTVNMSE